MAGNKEVEPRFGRRDFFKGIRNRLAGEEGSVKPERVGEFLAEIGVMIALIRAGMAASKVEMSTFITRSEKTMSEWHQFTEVQQKVRELCQHLSPYLQSLQAVKQQWQAQFLVTSTSTNQDGEVTITTEWEEPMVATGFHTTLDNLIGNLSGVYVKLERLVASGDAAFDLENGEKVLYQQSETSSIPAYTYVPIGVAFIFYEQILSYLEERNEPRSTRGTTLQDRFITRRAFLKIGTAGAAYFAIRKVLGSLQQSNEQALARLKGDVQKVLSTINAAAGEQFRRYFGMNYEELQQLPVKLNEALDTALSVDKTSGFFATSLQPSTKQALQQAVDQLSELKRALDSFFDPTNTGTYAADEDVLRVVNALWATDGIVSATDMTNLATGTRNWGLPVATGLGLGGTAFLAERFVFPLLDQWLIAQESESN